MAAGQTKLDVLRKALIEGEKSGVVKDFDVEEFLDEMKRRRLRPDKSHLR